MIGQDLVTCVHMLPLALVVFVIYLGVKYLIEKNKNHRPK